MLSLPWGLPPLPSSPGRKANITSSSSHHQSMAYNIHSDLFCQKKSKHLVFLLEVILNFILKSIYLVH